MYFQPEIETMPREELRKLQLERMIKLICHTAIHIDQIRL